MEKREIDISSGRAMRNGLVLSNDFVEVTVKIKKNSDEVRVETRIKKPNKKKTSKIISLIRKTPFVRGFFLLLVTLFSNPISLLSWLILGYLWVISPVSKVVQTDSFQGILLFYAVCIIGTIIWFRYMTDIAKWHGAEHMVSNAFWQDEPTINIYTARKYSRVTRYCGTTIAINMIVWFFIFLAFGFSSLSFVPAWMIAYELHKVKKVYWPLKPFFWLSGKAQEYLFTREPDDRQLGVALICLKKVMDESLNAQLQELKDKIHDEMEEFLSRKGEVIKDGSIESPIGESR